MDAKGDVVYIKVFDEGQGDVVFEGNVSTSVTPAELVNLRCFKERSFGFINKKSTYALVESFTGLHNVDLVADWGGGCDFVGVLYVEDGVLRKSKSVPSCEFSFIALFNMSHEECQNVFQCQVLEELDLNMCRLSQIPEETLVTMKRLKNVRLCGLKELKSIPEVIGDLSYLKELRIIGCGIETLPKRLKELKHLTLIRIEDINGLKLNAEDFAVFSKLKHLTIKWCVDPFTPLLSQLFWKMIQSNTNLRTLELDWTHHDRDIVKSALEESGSIVDGGWGSELYEHIFKRNKDNHKRAMECVLHLLAIRRWRNELNNVPKEMVKMIAMMLWNTRIEVRAWSKK